MEGGSKEAAEGLSYPLYDLGAVDEGALWLGGNDNLEGGRGSIGSLESGGALLSSGCWSISTEPGEEGLKWNGVKAELFSGASGGFIKSVDAPEDGLHGISKKVPSTTCLGTVKQESEKAWQSSVSDFPRTAGVIGDAVVGAKSTANSPPCVHPPPQRLPSTGSLQVDRNKGNGPQASSTGGSAAQHSNVQGALSSSASPVSAAALYGGKSRPIKATTISAGAAGAEVVKAEPVEGSIDHEAPDSEEEEEDRRNINENGDELGSCTDVSDKRRRNREHAKRSRMRKRVRLGGLEGMVLSLRRENVRLRQIIKQGIPDRADEIIRMCAKDNTNADTVAKQDVVQGMRPTTSITSLRWKSRGFGGSSSSISRSRLKLEGGGEGGRSKERCVPSALKLMSPSYQTVKALSESQANFILTNPNLPDCPIIFASQGFLDLTGYEASKVIGNNCRFLQGPGTDPTTVSILRNNLASGRDTSVCILNYKADGTPFWNQLSIGVLLDAHGQVANHVGVLCEVNQMPPSMFHKLLHRVPLPESLLAEESSDSGEDTADTKSNMYSARMGRSNSLGGSESAPRVVDRLRRTRAAAATAPSSTSN
uniref:Putative LOV domain-containing protein n=1 Tax=Sargassum hemiphyllum TaxID=127544 RepID=A0A126X309_SARHM|nr:putative LOV domain-containing protein [Sargassum hemiphyllum]